MCGGKIAFQNRLGKLIVRRKFTVFALFYFVFEGNFQVQDHQGAYILRGNVTEDFLRQEFGGLIFGGAYFRNFTVLLPEPYLKKLRLSPWPPNQS